VRDHLAARVLHAHGVRRVVMTGDPAWYDLECLGRPLAVPAEPRDIVISVPAAPMHHPAVEALAEGLRARFPDACIVGAFHHGWVAGPHVGEEAAAAYARLRERLEEAGHPAVDLAADLEAMESLYSSADLHVGWRLHAHLPRLSRRKPSFLLDEDCRGRGASEALGFRSVRSWAVRWRLGARRRLGHRAEAVPELLALIDEEVASGFTRLVQVPSVIDRTYEVAMKPFLERLP